MQMESRLIFPQTQHCLTKNNQKTKTACSASKNRKLRRERGREENTPGVLVYMAFLKGQANAENLHKMIKLFKFHRN